VDDGADVGFLDRTILGAVGSKVVGVEVGSSSDGVAENVVGDPMYVQ
jgi:hypothetical protein